MLPLPTGNVKQNRVGAGVLKYQTMQKTVFASVDECIADLREALPTLRMVETLARARQDGKRLAETKRLIAFLEDTEALRERLKASAKPDGSIQFSFTPEAWARFNEHRKQRE
jgi:hypothetical protein